GGGGAAASVELSGFREGVEGSRGRGVEGSREVAPAPFPQCTDERGEHAFDLSKPLEKLASGLFVVVVQSTTSQKLRLELGPRGGRDVEESDEVGRACSSVAFGDVVQNRTGRLAQLRRETVTLRPGEHF